MASGRSPISPSGPINTRGQDDSKMIDDIITKQVYRREASKVSLAEPYTIPYGASRQQQASKS